MGVRKVSKVDFTMENLEKCICGTCPVQVESGCAREKMEKLNEKIKETEGDNLPKPSDIPGLYCAISKTKCEDMDYSKMCQCNECPIWEEYGLIEGEPMGYYCRDGEAR